MQLYDMHTHTYLSSCASPEADPLGYVKAAEANGLVLLGFSDHAWDKAIPGAWSWYQNQDFERLKARREALTGYDSKLKIIYGAECEFAHGTIAVSEKAAEELDYIIVPHSHTHMVGYVLPADCDTPERHADYLIKSFYSLCTHEKKNLFFGVAHPMSPIGRENSYCEQIYSHIKDSDLDECLCAAKENGIFLELNTAVVSRLPVEKLASSWLARLYSRMKEMGNDLFLGSDKHSVIPHGQPDSFMSVRQTVSVLGLEESMFEKARVRAMML